MDHESHVISCDQDQQRSAPQPQQKERSSHFWSAHAFATTRIIRINQPTMRFPLQTTTTTTTTLLLSLLLLFQPNHHHYHYYCVALTPRGTAAQPSHKARVAVLGAGGYSGAVTFGFLQRCGALYQTGIASSHVRAMGATADTSVRLNIAYPRATLWTRVRGRNVRALGQFIA